MSYSAPVRLAMCSLGALAALSAGFRQGTLSAQKVPTLTAAQQEVLSHLSIVYLDDGQGGALKTLRVSDINVQIVSGSGATDSTTNGLGNLIVGYNELGNFDGDDRSGSHNMIVGKANSYSSYGGLVAGAQNTTSDRFASVSGGTGNRAIGAYASVVGGLANLSDDFASTVCGGQGNTASGGLAVVLGGRFNTASGTETVVCSGEGNEADADFAAVLGGAGNLASGPAAVVCGGGDNRAFGAVSAVSGGQGNQADHLTAVVSGGCGNSTSGACDHKP